MLISTFDEDQRLKSFIHSLAAVRTLEINMLLLLSILQVAAASLEFAPPSLLLPPTPLDEYNTQLRDLNHRQAELAWNMSLELTPATLAKNERLLVDKNRWNNEWCMNLLRHTFNSMAEQRQVYLICRGPRFSSYQVSKLIGILGQLRSVYDTTKICLTSGGECYKMEPELNNFMERRRNEGALREAWLKWHDTIGQALAKPYADLVRLMNQGARQAGHEDIGACWREEMETEDLIHKSISLYANIKHLYSLLHSYVRHRLEIFYGMSFNLIPAHLLGNMWGQRWDSLMDILLEHDSDPAEYVKKHIHPNATVLDMVKYAEQYYISMGFPPLPPTFYTNSYFTSSTNSTSKNCHGSAANMFSSNVQQDYRIMFCASVRDSDLTTIIHEMGHIHYFMAYSNLPTIFQDGANAAFQEAAGDSTTYGLWPEPSVRDLLHLGLMKLPQIGFGLVVDLWRWRVFADEGGDVRAWNEDWWRLQGEFMGVERPGVAASAGLDALGKYHIVDNIPYIRYFQASFLQHMFYGSMCGGGRRYCKLDGRGGKLRQMMGQGSSKHWSIVLQEMTGKKEISAGPLLEYFKPLEKWLEGRVESLGLRVGW